MRIGVLKDYFNIWRKEMINIRWKLETIILREQFLPKLDLSSVSKQHCYPGKLSIHKKSIQA